MAKRGVKTQKQTEPPYSLLAPLWKNLMSHVDYRRWGLYLGRLARRYQITGKNLLEIACGECSIEPYLPWKNCVLQLHTDLSLAMLREAKDCLWPRIAMDCRALALGNALFDVVIMNYDAFNYLAGKDLRPALLEVHRVLLKGGYFIFDVTTEQNSLRNFANACDVVEQDGQVLLRRSFYDELNKSQHNQFDLFLPRGKFWERKSEFHTQYIHDSNVLHKVLEECKFQVVAVHGDFTLGEPNATAERLHWIVRRP